VISAHHAVTRVDCGAFDDGKDVALARLRAETSGPWPLSRPAILSISSRKDDAGVFDSVNGDARDLLHIDQALLFFLDQILEGLVDLHLPLLGALAEDVGQHVLEIDVHFLYALVGDDFERRKIALAGFDFDGAVVEFAFAQLLTQFLAGAAGGFVRVVVASMTTLPSNWRLSRSPTDAARSGAEEYRAGRSSAFSSALSETSSASLRGPFRWQSLTRSRIMDSTSRPDVADFRELGSFDLQERRVGQLGEAARDLGFADAGGADHNYVLGDDLFGHFGRKLLPPHALRRAMATARFASF